LAKTVFQTFFGLCKYFSRLIGGCTGKGLKNVGTERVVHFDTKDQKKNASRKNRSYDCFKHGFFLRFYSSDCTKPSYALTSAYEIIQDNHDGEHQKDMNKAAHGVRRD
jgi:hypothetical protein